jgi:hypothetical protein
MPWTLLSGVRTRLSSLWQTRCFYGFTLSLHKNGRIGYANCFGFLSATETKEGGTGTLPVFFGNSVAWLAVMKKTARAGNGYASGDGPYCGAWQRGASQRASV